MRTAFTKQSVPVMISVSITASGLFGSAGRWNWPNGWIVVGLSFLTGLAATALVWRDPNLVAERRNLKAGETWDKATVGLVVAPGRKS